MDEGGREGGGKIRRKEGGEPAASWTFRIWATPSLNWNISILEATVADVLCNNFAELPKPEIAFAVNCESTVTKFSSFDGLGGAENLVG